MTKERKFKMMKNYCCTIIFILLSFHCSSQNNATLNSFFDEEKWTECRVGNMPVVISVPHGGRLQLDNIGDRVCPDAVTVTDKNTIELALEIEAAFLQKYGLRPYIILCHLSRKEVDQNREIKIATCGNSAMERAWHAFHNFIDSAIANATMKFGGCLYIDLHGHGHPVQRLELGYGINATDLPLLKASGNIDSISKKSTLNNLLKIGKDNFNFRDLVIGKNSFGTMMANKGFASIPSEQDVIVAANENYFNGGFNARRYTSKNYPSCFGWQIETNFKGVRDEKGRPFFAEA